MLRTRALFILITLLFTWVENISGQVNDANLWMSVTLEKKITKDLSAGLSQELRLNENCTEAGTWFTDLGLEYRINKLFRVAVNYRYVGRRQLDDYYFKSHKYYADLTFRQQFKPWTLQFRTRFQNRSTDLLGETDVASNDIYNRNKLMLKYETSTGFVPYAYTEWYTPLNNPEHTPFDKVRYCIGTEYNISRAYQLDFFYMIDREFNVNNPLTNFVIGIGYKVSF